MLTRWKSVRKYDPLATVEDGLTSEGMLLLVVVVWETPDEGVVVLADVGVGVAAGYLHVRSPSAPVTVTGTDTDD